MKGARPELARRVCALRRYRGWNQEELAKEAKLHKNTISNLESGRGDCLLSTVYYLAEAFKVDVRDLLMPLRRDAPAWVARIEADTRRALTEIEALKQMSLPSEAKKRVELVETRLRRGLEGLQQVKLRLGDVDVNVNEKEEEEPTEGG